MKQEVDPMSVPEATWDDGSASTSYDDPGAATGFTDPSDLATQELVEYDDGAADFGYVGDASQEANARVSTLFSAEVEQAFPIVELKKASN